uniref:Uncharacterized protein n=1 Tax=viral metagenome TaxID=1070528 RepID=A0A6M3LTK9_9ZZZZ
MKIKLTTTKRSFDLLGFSEAEGLILRTLLNLNEEGVAKALMADELYWSREVGDKEEAIEIGCDLVNKIMKAVDL